MFHEKSARKTVYSGEGLSKYYLYANIICIPLTLVPTSKTRIYQKGLLTSPLVDLRRNAHSLFSNLFQLPPAIRNVTGRFNLILPDGKDHSLKHGSIKASEHVKNESSNFTETPKAPH